MKHIIRTILVVSFIVFRSDLYALDLPSSGNLIQATALSSKKSLPKAIQFNVKEGCRWKGRNIAAKGDGLENDTTAIQNCLYAAGELFAKQCPARAWNAVDGYPQCEQVKVFLPQGHYFVEGEWETTYPGHSSLNNSAYVPQWVVFSLPRGVALLGESMESTKISLTRSEDCKLDKDRRGQPILGSNTCTGSRFDKRRGTYLFMGGFEKLSGYCDQTEARRNNFLCQLSEDEKLASGSQNSFEELTLDGDLDALANHWHCNEGGCKMKSQSTAIHFYRGRDLQIKRVTSNYWYRGLNSREVNGARVVQSHFLNSHKGSIYFILPQGPSSENYNIGSDSSSRLLTYVGTNNVANSPYFLGVLEGKGVQPWGALSGIYFTGNISSVACSDVAVVNNTLRYARIYYEQPCGSVLIERNKVSRTGMPIQVGSYENNNGLNIAKDISILDNQISESLSGILVRGCDFNGTSRCESPSARPIVYGNIISNFLPVAGEGSDVWVSKMGRSKKTLAGIVVSDASYVVVENNKIRDLQKGSQSYGIGVQSSRWNTNYNLDSPNCYAPIRESREIKLYNNDIEFKSTNNAGLSNVGVYIENSLGVDFVSGSMSRVQSNRLINSTLIGEGDSLFCSSQSGSSANCPRRLDAGRTLMSRSCLNNLAGCVFNIPGISRENNRTTFLSRYSSTCNFSNKDASDEELVW
jgi:hypothetical protein